jgi:hypothetical protein
MKFAALGVEKSVEEIGLDERVVRVCTADGVLVTVQQQKCRNFVQHFDELAIHCHNVSAAIGWVGVDLIDNVTRDF